MQTADDLISRLEMAEGQLEELTAEVATNQEKLRRTQQRELRLMQAEDLDALIREMLWGLRTSYGLEHVSLVL